MWLEAVTEIGNYIAIQTILGVALQKEHVILDTYCAWIVVTK